jgi:hypothetical protein
MAKANAVFAFGVIGTVLMFALAWLVTADEAVRHWRFRVVGVLFVTMAVVGLLWGIYTFGFLHGQAAEEDWGTIFGFLGLVCALPLGIVGALFLRAGRKS